ncbi:OLC1v1023912C1 [Oldenlandia corymbosa var. corymbosa]|uniref:OLC1v1023912C1 n=1 Tax=Oldenlandia corymbosa var. corymbosa TaxID=529605 RepID=A0AAV1C196_OLDCO|nr:OLC1v1023912C1 [Oldenlandia corymbosa var. corymbosa]
MGKGPNPQWMIYPANPENAVSTNQLPCHTSYYYTGAEPCISLEKPFTNIVNGLICIWHKNPRQMELLNLTTRERMALPLPPGNQKGKPTFCLGFDPVKKQYKVLGSSHTRKNRYVMTLSNDMSWRKVANLPRVPISRSHTCVDGAIFWRKDLYEGGRREVQYFDIAEERFKLLNIKEQVGLKYFDMNFVTDIGGKFTWAGLLRTSNLPEIRITLWTLINKHDLDWVESQVQIPKCRIPRKIISFRNISIVGCTTDSSKVLIKSSLNTGNQTRDSLIFYNLETQEFRTVQLRFEEMKLSSKIIGFDVSFHVENILPLNFSNVPPSTVS